MTQRKELTGDPWMHYMKSGDFENAWRVSDEVLKERAGKPCWHFPRHQQYFWDGSSLKAKRVLVRCYHGLGDTIQFIRFVPQLREIAKEVIVWAQRPLIPLLQTVPGIDRLLPLHDGTPDVSYDADIEIMELAHIFRVTTETIPQQIPYLHVTPKPLSLSGQPAVGLVWKAGNYNEHRSIPYEYLQPLSKVNGIDLFILQGEAESAGWQEGFGRYFGNLNLLEYARVLSTMDVLISVDSMPVHLAGAMGVPVLNLLHFDADWRWMNDRADSPWYPTMKIIRQKAAGDWPGVIAQVIAELEVLKVTHSSVETFGKKLQVMNS